MSNLFCFFYSYYDLDHNFKEVILLFNIKPAVAFSVINCSLYELLCQFLWGAQSPHKEGNETVGIKCLLLR